MTLYRYKIKVLKRTVTCNVNHSTISYQYEYYVVIVMKNIALISISGRRVVKSFYTIFFVQESNAGEME
jgi:hypothetical protein